MKAEMHMVKSARSRPGPPRRQLVSTRCGTHVLPSIVGEHTATSIGGSRRVAAWFRRHAPLILIVLLALAVRAVHLDYGLPSIFHPDERFVVGPALRIAETGDLDPGFYNYPALPMYVLAAVFFLEDGFDSDAARNTSDAVHMGRRVTTLFGLATVVALYAAGALWRSRETGLWAAGVLAITPFHVLDSHYTNVDVPMTFWAVCSVGCALACVRTGRSRWFLLASAAVGLAAASKYTAFVLLALIVTTAAIEPRTACSVRSRCARIATGCFVALGTFSLAAPYTWIRFAAVREAFGFERAHVAGGHWGWDLNVGGWLYQPVVYQLAAALPFVLGLALYGAALGGAFTTIRRPSRESLLLWAALLPLFGAVCWSPVVFPRYLLPCVPLLALFAAGFLQDRLWASHRRRVVGLAIATVVLAYTAALTVSQLAALSPQNARMASLWIRQNVKPGSTIAVASLVETHGIPKRAYDVSLFRPDLGLAAEWIVVDSWYETALERGQLRHGAANRMLKALGDEGSAYQKVVTFEASYVTERLYGALDPYFKNQFESPDYTIYRRRPGHGALVPPNSSAEKHTLP
jgi:4-amino-4-deoxy-L-arabinose transferase-like glycosyltransferase